MLQYYDSTGACLDRDDPKWKPACRQLIQSYKWQQGIESVNQLPGEGIVKIHMGDREADINELFFNTPDEKAELLIGVRHNRKTAAGSELWQHINKQKVAAEEEIIIPDCTGKRKKSTG